jgi:hypothetical protein
MATGTGSGYSDWRKSSFSVSDGECLEVRRALQMIEIRDSEDPDGARLSFTKYQWRTFLKQINLST